MLRQAFVTRTGRLIDLAVCLVQNSSVLAARVPQPAARNQGPAFEQFTFFGDKVWHHSMLLQPYGGQEAGSPLGDRLRSAHIFI